MTFSEEQLAKLPYQTTPAEMADVVKEITRLVALVSSVAADMLEDRTKGAGLMVTIQETRLGLALESWLGEDRRFTTTSVAEAIVAYISESFGDLHNAAHGTTTEPERHLFVGDTEGAVDDAGTVPPDEDGS